MVAYFTAGAAVSLGYALVLWMSASAIVRQRSIAPLVAGVAMRLGLLTAATYTLIATEPDSASVLAALLGFLVTRALVMAAIPGLAPPPSGET
jgi:hypothetical protein